MRLIGVPVSSLTAQHIADLPANKVGESRTVEFKLTLPGNSSDDKKEFLADVSALANSLGGVIVYGMETERDASGQDTGVAKKVVGLPGINADKEKQRLSSMLHDGIAPSLASHIALRDLDGPVQGAPVIVLGVSQSLARPHMITFQKSGKLWRRSDSGKYQPDVEELRSMFNESQSWIEEAESFRQRRISAIRGNEPAFPNLKRDTSLFVHVLPLGRLGLLLNLKNHLNHLRTAVPPLGYYNGLSFAFNADGYLVYYNTGQAQFRNYAQWFRFGGVEGYDAYIVDVRESFGGQRIHQLFANEIVKDVREFVPKAIAGMEALGVEPPYVVLISLLGISNARIDYGRGLMTDAIVPDRLLLPPLILEDETSDPVGLITPLFDIIYQAAGLNGVPEALANLRT